MSRIRVTNAAGGWRDEGPARPHFTPGLRGWVVIGEAEGASNKKCGMPMVKGGVCGRADGHLNNHTAETVMASRRIRKADRWAMQCGARMTAGRRCARARGHADQHSSRAALDHMAERRRVA